MPNALLHNLKHNKCGRAQLFVTVRNTRCPGWPSKSARRFPPLGHHAGRSRCLRFKERSGRARHWTIRKWAANSSPDARLLSRDVVVPTIGGGWRRGAKNCSPEPTTPRRSGGPAPQQLRGGVGSKWRASATVRKRPVYGRTVSAPWWHRRSGGIGNGRARSDGAAGLRTGRSLPVSSQNVAVHNLP